MRCPRRRTVAIFGGALLVAVLARACVLRHREPAPGDGEHAAAKISEADGVKVVTLDERAAAGSGICAAPLAAAVHRSERSVFGMVLDPLSAPREAEGGAVCVRVRPPGEGAAPAPGAPAHLTLPDGTIVTALPAGGSGPAGGGLVYCAPGGAEPPVPGTMLPIALPAGPETAGSLVPDAAVVWADGKAWVYASRGGNAFARIEIAADTRVGGGWFVAGGAIPPGTQVVVAGAQLLLSDEFLSQYEIIEIAE